MTNSPNLGLVHTVGGELSTLSANWRSTSRAGPVTCRGRGQGREQSGKSAHGKLAGLHETTNHCCCQMQAG